MNGAPLNSLPLCLRIVSISDHEQRKIISVKKNNSFAFTPPERGRRGRRGRMPKKSTSFSSFFFPLLILTAGEAEDYDERRENRVDRTSK